MDVDWTHPPGVNTMLWPIVETSVVLINPGNKELELLTHTEQSVMLAEWILIATCCHFWFFLFIVSLKKKKIKIMNCAMQSFWHAAEKSSLTRPKRSCVNTSIPSHTDLRQNTAKNEKV